MVDMFSCDKIILFRHVIFLGFIPLVNHQLQFTVLGHFHRSKIWLLLLIFFLIFICFSPNDHEDLASAHFFGGGNNTDLIGTLNETAGNFVVELLLNPSKPMVDKEIAFITEIKSTQGDELIELPVSYYILKDGKPVYSHPNNFTLVTLGHYNFNYTFSEPGKYLLYVDVKDIFYSLDIVNLKFEFEVRGPVLERILELLKVFLMNYYYAIIFFIALIGISFVVRWQRSKEVQKARE